MISVDVITPVRDGMRHLERCAGSLAAQGLTKGQLRWMVVDDGSSDETPDWLNYNAGRLSVDVWWTRLDRSYGAGLARDVALERVQADYVTFLDVDDTIEPAAVSRWLSHADSLGADLLMTPAPPGLSRRRRARFGGQPRLLKPNDRWSSEALRTWLVGGKLYRADVLEALRFSAAPEAEDLAFFAEALVRSHTTAWSGETPRYRYVHPSTSSAWLPITAPLTVLDTYGSALLTLRTAAPTYKAFRSAASPVWAGQCAAYLRALGHASESDVGGLSACLRKWWRETGLELPRHLAALDRRDVSQISLAFLCQGAPTALATAIAKSWIEAARIRHQRLRAIWPGRSARTDSTPRP